MPNPEWLPAVIKQLRHRPIVPEGAGTPVQVGRVEIERLLPHRAPMLLVDVVDVVDVARQAVRGRRRIGEGDLGLAGHFPGEPIYPGVLLIEAMGQLGLTLLHFALKRTTVVPPEATPPLVRATHIHHATFVAPVVPGDDLVLHASVVESGLTMIAAGQVFKNGVLAAYAVAEVYVDE